MKNTVKQIAAGTFIALLLIGGNVKSEGTEVKTLGLETVVETSLQLESWMTKETVWNSNSVYMTDFDLEAETHLELESWMTSENIWNVKETEVEAELTLENWMVDNKVWK